MLKTLLLLSSVLMTSCICRKLPTTFKRCNIRKPDFNQCLTEAIPNAIRQLKSPIGKLGLPSLEPLVIPAMSISTGDGPTGFQQNYTDVKVSGLTKISCSKIEMNPEATQMLMNCTNPQTKIEFDYWFNGTISVMPIYGNGTGYIILDQVKVLHKFTLEKYQKKGKDHFKVANSSIDFDPEMVTFRFNNLYNGDEFLGENMNLIMNDNWKEIYADSKPSYEEIFRVVFQALFNSLLARVSASELFEGW